MTPAACIEVVSGLDPNLGGVQDAVEEVEYRVVQVCFLLITQGQIDERCLALHIPEKVTGKRGSRDMDLARFNRGLAGNAVAP